MNTKPTVVCLCGSTRFSEAFQKANLTETLAGRIVLTIGCDMRSDAELFADKTEAELTEIKQQLDLLHLRKIDLADEVLILNVDGYVGQSTKREWEYAVKTGKRVRWLEPDKTVQVGNHAKILKHGYCHNIGQVGEITEVRIGHTAPGVGSAIRVTFKSSLGSKYDVSYWLPILAGEVEANKYSYFEIVPEPTLK